MLLKRMIWPKLGDCIPLSGEVQVPVMFLNIWKVEEQPLRNVL